MQAIVGGFSGDSEGGDRVGQIEAELARLSTMVSRLIAEPGPRSEEVRPLAEAMRFAQSAAAPSPVSFAHGRARMIRESIRHRRRRERHFASHLLADPGWDMLLDLYAAHYEGQKVAVSSLCIAAAVPATTALRWIRTMEEEGHFVREHDPADRRRIFIGLSEASRTRLDEYFDEIGA